MIAALTVSAFWFASSGEYKTVKQMKTVYVHPSSVMAHEEVMPKWVCYHELAFTSKEYMRNVLPIEPDWLCEIAPHYYKKKDVEDDSGKKLLLPMYGGEHLLP